MSLRTKLVSSLVSLTVAAVAVAGTVEQSAAKKLSNGEIAAIAGIGGLVLGLGIANAGHGPGYYDNHSSPWERHVDRCYARYKTYDHVSDTYMSLSGYPRRCRL